MSKQKIKKTKKTQNETAEKESTVGVEELKDAAGVSAAEKKERPWEKELDEKLKALDEKYMRLLAEYDNFRKRASREIEEILRTANEELIIELLPILDNLDRATQHKNDRETFEEYEKGIELIENQLRDVLARAGLAPMEVVGKPFDPNFHDALLQIETDEYESGIITSENLKGYMLSGKVIRHPKVIVSK